MAAQSNGLNLCLGVNSHTQRSPPHTRSRGRRRETDAASGQVHKVGFDLNPSFRPDRRALFVCLVAKQPRKETLREARTGSRGERSHRRRRARLRLLDHADVQTAPLSRKTRVKVWRERERETRGDVFSLMSRTLLIPSAAASLPGRCPRGNFQVPGHLGDGK